MFIWHGAEKPKFVGNLLKKLKGMIKVESIHQDLVSESELTRLMDEAFTIHLLSKDQIDQNLATSLNSIRIFVDRKNFIAQGVDINQFLRLIMELNQEPIVLERALNELHLARITEGGSEWVAGHAFLDLLLNKIYTADKSRMVREIAA